jgi:hypothetical protein
MTGFNLTYKISIIKVVLDLFCWFCYITADFATAASQNDVCITQQMCHTMMFFHDFFIIKDESNIIFYVF